MEITLRDTERAEIASTASTAASRAGLWGTIKDVLDTRRHAARIISEEEAGIRHGRVRLRELKTLLEDGKGDISGLVESISRATETPTAYREGFLLYTVGEAVTWCRLVRFAMGMKDKAGRKAFDPLAVHDITAGELLQPIREMGYFAQAARDGGDTAEAMRIEGRLRAFRRLVWQALAPGSYIPAGSAEKIGQAIELWKVEAGTLYREGGRL